MRLRCTSRVTASLLASAIALAIGACASESSSKSGETPVETAPTHAAQLTARSSGSSGSSIMSIMHAKLDHAQEIVEGLTLGDFDQISRNAQALRGISQQSAWVVNDSAAYLAMSVRFREICDDIAYDAQSHQLDAAANDFTVLTHACVSCHSFLRRERETRDMPGRMSMLERLTQDATMKGKEL